MHFDQWPEMGKKKTTDCKLWQVKLLRVKVAGFGIPWYEKRERNSQYLTHKRDKMSVAGFERKYSGLPYIEFHISYKNMVRWLPGNRLL